MKFAVFDDVTLTITKTITATDAGLAALQVGAGESVAQIVDGSFIDDSIVKMAEDGGGALSFEPIDPGYTGDMPTSQVERVIS
jgi:hypothetical protein